MNPPPSWRQLCTVARLLLKADPTVDDHEWSERIKDRIVQLRREYPKPHDITAAMRTVARVHSRSLALPVRLLTREPRPGPPPLTQAEAAALSAKYQALIRTMDTPRLPGLTVQQQVDRWRSEQLKPVHVKTAKGWKRVRRE